MAGGGSFISDQKFTTLTADGNFKTITGGSTNLGPCRVTYIQAHAATASGNIIFESTFGSEGLDLYVPGNGIRFENTIYADVTGSGSVTIGYTG